MKTKEELMDEVLKILNKHSTFLGHKEFGDAGFGIDLVDFREVADELIEKFKHQSLIYK